MAGRAVAVTANGQTTRAAGAVAGARPAVDPRRGRAVPHGVATLQAGIGTGEKAMTWNEVLNLVERAREGDRVAYGELVTRFQPAVYAVALARLRNPGEAQELTQEVFIHGMTKLAQLRDAHCFAGWLRQITVRMAINRLTRRGPVRGGDGSI